MALARAPARYGGAGGVVCLVLFAALVEWRRRRRRGARAPVARRSVVVVVVGELCVLVIVFGFAVLVIAVLESRADRGDVGTAGQPLTQTLLS